MSAPTTWTDDHFVAGDIALDFANTIYRRKPKLGADLFNNNDALVGWLARVRLLPGNANFEDPDAALSEARSLRELFWGIFEAQSEDREPPADAVAGLLNIAGSGIGTDISIGPDGSATPRTPRGALIAVALHGIRLALNPPRQRVRACDECGWFFVDTSRGRRRRWCSMKTCGNRAKAARYRSAHVQRN